MNPYLRASIICFAIRGILTLGTVRSINVATRVYVTEYVRY